MSDPNPKKRPQSRAVQVCTIICLVIGIVGFQIVAPGLFPTPPGGGFNIERTLWAAVVGAVSAVIGAGIGTLIDRLGK
jgi:hypothetical protein